MAIKLERSGRGLEALRYLELAISRAATRLRLQPVAIVLIRSDSTSRRRETLLKPRDHSANPVYRATWRWSASAGHRHAPELQVHKRSQDE